MKELEDVNNKIDVEDLYQDVAVLIDNAKKNVVLHVNTEFVILNWNIGKKIKNEILKNNKPEYGKQVIKELSKKLIKDYGKGYSYSNLYRMLQINECFKEFENFATLSQKLSWSHFVELAKIDKDIKRRFYTTMCMNENWSVRTLKGRIDSAMFERTYISKKPEKTIINDLKLLGNENKMTFDLFFRDPYILDFLELKDTYSEKDLENAIINELEKFILEMGNDFAFLSIKKRITIDGKDFYIDLLFYHIKLKCYVAVELKISEFIPEYGSKMGFYLTALDEKVKDDSDNPSIGIILCQSKNNEIVDYTLKYINKPLGVSEYKIFNELPNKLLETLPTEDEINMYLDVDIETSNE